MATSNRTVVETQTCQTSPLNPPTLVLGLNPSNQTGPRVRWSKETIDNEHMNKKKSKCCCIYTKPHDPHSNEDHTDHVHEFDNCHHCRYHTESDYTAQPDERKAKVQLVVKKS